MAAEPITVADTVGAGDSFMAGLIFGLAQLQALGAGGRQRLNRLRRTAAHRRRLRQPRRGDHLLPARRKSAPLRGTRPVARAVNGPGGLTA